MATASELLPWRISRAALLVAVVAVVVVFETKTADAFGLPKVIALWTAAVISCAAWVLAARQRRRWLPPSRFLVLAGVHVGVVAVATALSISRVESLFGSYERYGGLLSRLVFVGLALLVVALYWEERDGLSDIAAAITVGAAVVTGYVLLQAAGFDWIDWREPSGIKATFQGSTMGNSDFAGGLLAVALPFILFTAWRARGGGRARLGVFVLALAAADVVGVVVTRSRGGLLAVAGAGVVGAVAYWRRIPFAVRWLAAGSVALVLAGGITLLVSPGLARVSGLDRTDLLRTKSLAIRAREWSAASKVVIHHPILGTGPDTFEYVFPRYRNRADGRELGLQIADKPHNVLLEHATDTGVLGLASYLAVVAVCLVGAVRRLRGAAVDVERGLLVTFVAGTVAYLAQAAVSIDVTPLALVGWICLGALSVLADPLVLRRRSEVDDASRRGRLERGRARGRGRGGGGGRAAGGRGDDRRSASTGWTALVVTAAGGLVVTALWPLSADLQAARAQHATDRAAAALAWQRAVNAQPWQISYRVGLGFANEARGAEANNVDERRQFFMSALEQYGRARQLAPRSLLAVLGSARTEALMAAGVDPAHFAESDRSWGQAATLDPQDWEVHEGYALMLNSWSNASGGDAALRRRAASEFEATLNIKPDRVSAWVNLGKVRQALGDVAGARDAAARALVLDPSNADAQAIANAGPR